MDLKDYLEELQKIKMLGWEEEAALWRRFKEAADQDARRILIESYQPLVFKAAAAFKAAPSVMDIIQEGTVGLIEAAEKYDHRRGVAFSLYALHRIRGRMLDFLEKEGQQSLTYIDNPMYNRDSEFFSLEEIVDGAPSTAEQVEDSFLAAAVRDAMQRLPAGEQQVLAGVYLRDAAAKEMAAEMAVTPSHVYRLRKQGIRRIRGMLSKLMQHW